MTRIRWRTLLAVTIPPLTTLTAHATVFWGYNTNSNPGTRGPRVQADAAHAAFVSSFAVTGFESFEGFAPGTVSTKVLFNFVGANRLGSVGNFVNSAPWVQSLPTGTNGGAYPTHLNKYLGLGLPMSSGGATTNTMRIVFSQPVQGFGFYMTDAEQIRPVVDVYYASGGPTSHTLPITIGQQGSIAFWGWKTNGPAITSVWLRNFGQTGPPSDRVGLDRMTVGIVPEPGTLLACAAGLVGLAMRRRKAVAR